MGNDTPPAAVSGKPFFSWSYNHGQAMVRCPECQGVGEYRYHHDPTGEDHVNTIYPAATHHDEWWWKPCWVCNGRAYVALSDCSPYEVNLLNEMVEDFKA